MRDTELQGRLHSSAQRTRRSCNHRAEDGAGATRTPPHAASPSRQHPAGHLARPHLLMTASSSSSRKTLGLGFPSWGSGVTVPTSTKPKPTLYSPSTASPCLSKPAARPSGLRNRRPRTRTSCRAAPPGDTGPARGLAPGPSPAPGASPRVPRTPAPPPPPPRGRPEAPPGAPQPLPRPPPAAEPYQRGAVGARGRQQPAGGSPQGQAVRGLRGEAAQRGQHRRLQPLVARRQRRAQQQPAAAQRRRQRP